MVLTTHALVGAAIGKYSNNLAVIAGASVVMHYAMDILRHGDYYEEERTLFQGFIKELLDLLIAGILISAIIYFKKPAITEIYYMLWGVVWSLLPDLLTLLYDKFNIKFLGGIYKFNYWIHHLLYTDSERQWVLKNLTNDFIISSAAIILLLFFNFKF